MENKEKNPVRDRRYKKFINPAEDDPLAAVANLFDVAMVFAVALILAMFSALSVPELLTSKNYTVVKNPGKKDMEIITKEGVKIDRYRMTDETMSGGSGKRLGTAYMLPNGEVIYVPESKQ